MFIRNKTKVVCRMSGIDFIVYLIVNLMRFVIILIKLLCMYVCIE